ncbi:MAG TPA: hypothetical protein VHE78_06315 [Gemmatimonadaceae bacterium]|nr:hypothetical protein [Gemmatimonadaceae bacterium]
MIFFVAPHEQIFPMEDFLRGDESGALRDRIRVLTYEEVFARRALPVGAYIFSAIDQLTPTGAVLVARCRHELARAAQGIALLNDPLAVRRRGELLHAAFETGRNLFRVTRADGFTLRHRYPVFVRCEREHTGSLTPLLWSRWRLNLALLAACARGYRLRDLLVVEYCHTADAGGIFRKYSAYIVGDRIVPRSLIQSREWVTKDHDRLFTEEAAREEFDYVTTNPHEAWLRETFRLARAEYGRVDYGVLDGRPQVWEVNLNPTIGRRAYAHAHAPAHAPADSRRTESQRTDSQRALVGPARAHFYRSFRAALERLDCGENPRRAVQVSVSAADDARLESERRTRARVLSRQTAVSRLLHPPLRLLKRAIRR